MRVLIEKYSGDHSEEEREVSDGGELDSLLDELGDGDASLSFGAGLDSEEADLIVGVTPEGYTLTRLHDDDYQELVGSPGADGEVELIMGGQSAPTPRRSLTSRSEVSRILAQYLRDQTFPGDLTWEQG